MSDRITLGRYEIIEEIGRGGSGIVYRAYDSDRDQIVALKIMHPRLVNEPEFIERFRQEAELSATIKSVHLVPTYDYGEIEGRLYISMELMEGGSLKNRIEQDGPYSPQDAILVIHQICIGLSEIHKLDIIHRDLKPGNILFDKEDKVKISDLGFAKILDAATSLSKTGEVIGTPSYMSPEIWGGGNVTARADIYSLACIVAEMLTGNVLFDGESTPEIMLLHYQPAKLPYDLPAKWRTALIRALAIDAEQRHESVNAFYDELKKASMPEVTEKGKPSFQTRPVLGSDKPTPLPSRPLFEPGKPSQTSTPPAPSQPGIPITRSPQQQEQSGPRPPIFRHQPPIPPAQAPQTSPQTPPSGQTIPTKEQNTPSPAVPIFTPIQRTPQNAFKPSKTETDPAQQGASAIPVFQPIRSGFTPKPSVPRPMPPPLEPNQQTPMPTPRPFNTPGIVPPMPEMDSNSDKPKKKKKESRRERRKREKAQSQQAFKPLFNQESPFTSETVAPGMVHTVAAETPSPLSENINDISTETGFPEMPSQEPLVTKSKKGKNKKLNLVLGIIAVLLLAGVLFFSWLLINDNQLFDGQSPAMKTATVQSIRQIPNHFVKQNYVTDSWLETYDHSNNFLESYYPASKNPFKNFSFKVTFHNPDSIYFAESITQIIGFRQSSNNNHFRFTFNPVSGSWKFQNWMGGTDNIVEISSGNSSHINKKAGAINQVQLIANGNSAYVFINGFYITRLDLSARDFKGEIWIATQYTDANRHGYKTPYSGMELYAPK
jgi:serine/threonine protein kinase